VPIVYDVERIRDGRSFATRRTVARQHGQAIFYVTASFHVEEAGFDHQNAMPAVPQPEECPSLGDLYRKVTGRPDDRSWEREWAALDVRYAADSRPGGTLVNDVEPARTQIWIRVAGAVPDDAVVHACLLTYASDLTLLGVALVPHGLLISSPKVQPASLDHSMWFHRGFRADSWMLYDQRSPSASGATGFATGTVFARTGALIASVAQEGLIRPIAR
jgi:acyl-CoA thioesterase-2